MLLIIICILMIIFIFALNTYIKQVRLKKIFSLKLETLIVILFSILVTLSIVWLSLCVNTLHYIQIKDAPVEQTLIKIQNSIINGEVNTVEKCESIVTKYQTCKSDLKTISYFRENYDIIRWWLDLAVL